MSKAVLISIQPKWCEMIANGKKTVEIRKSRPKIDTPFKCYIYCTSDRSDLWILRESFRKFHGGKIASLCNAKDVGGATKVNGKVVGEFVCDKIYPIKVYSNCAIQNWNCYNLSNSCLSLDAVAEYIGANKTGYSWHISDLKIYDIPRELNEFGRYGQLPCEKACPYEKCEHFKYMRVNANEYDYDCDCNGLLDNFISLKRPPQSWCYVEEREDNSQLLGNASQSDAADIAQDVLKPATPENFELMPG